ncbi:hypothetical protein Leryth_026157 [Lithospermum erythrorhizon]|nr:hypothetical protein Leryth_026157 [Lithospermum erythrorhizon]
MDKEERNALRRDRYKANRDEINKRRRKVYSEKRRHLEFANESSSANTVEVHPMLDKASHDQILTLSVVVVMKKCHQAKIEIAV